MTELFADSPITSASREPSKKKRLVLLRGTGAAELKGSESNGVSFTCSWLAAIGDNGVRFPLWEGSGSCLKGMDESSPKRRNGA